MYHKVKIFGSDPVENIFHGIQDLAEGPEKENLDEALSHFIGFTGGQLVHVTHQKNGAWEKCYIPGSLHSVIPNEYILEEYKNIGQ